MNVILKNIKKKYGKQYVLNDISMTLTEGVYGILGPNGAGKTTLINIMIGVLKQNEGSVCLDEEDIRVMGTKYLNYIGYLPQYPAFYKNFSNIEFLKYMCALKGIPKSAVNAKIDEVLEMVNLTEERNKLIGALSGGMRQRLGIAQAVLNNPKILILDEPTAGLDPGERIRFRNIISKLSKNRIILVTTHIVSDVEYIAKEIVILKKGKLILKGEPDTLAKKIDGEVWQVKADEKRMAELSEQYIIGNVKREQDLYDLRIINQSKPDPNARLVPPILEDVFLSVFRRQD